MPTALTGWERLDIGSYPMANPACFLRDLTGMWRVEYRGASVPVPYVHGRVSYATRLDELTVIFPGLLIGERDSDGGVHADPRAGLVENYEELYAAVLAPVDTGDGTRAVTWHKGNGATWTGTVRVAGFDVRAQDPAAIGFSLTLAFPAGRLEP